MLKAFLAYGDNIFLFILAIVYACTMYMFIVIVLHQIYIIESARYEFYILSLDFSTFPFYFVWISIQIPMDKQFQGD
jgi:hypothetical protein